MPIFRWAPRAMAGAAALFVLSSGASAGDHLQTERRHVPTGGKLNLDAPLPGEPRRAPRRADNNWLTDFITRLIDGEPTPATRQRRIARAPRPAPQQAAAAPIAAPSAPQTPATLPRWATPQSPAPTQSAPTPSPIVTGALPAPPAPRPEPLPADDLTTQTIREAERTQTRLDLVKLELASRTYAERRLAGQSAFDTRNDWRVLERARDALTRTEWAVADSAGFEANAYVNDADKVIVVAIAGVQDLRRDFLEEGIWRALIQSQAPQQFFLAKNYVRSVIQRYQLQGYATECVGHSLGGGACAYAAAELNIRAIVVNPISAGALGANARHLITNYIVDGDIANYIYGRRGNEITGDVHRIAVGKETARSRLAERYGMLAGPILVIRDLRDSVKVHQIDRALDLIATHAGALRTR